MSQITGSAVSTAQALRDFFCARCAEELSAVAPALCGKRLGDAEAKALEFEFNRLFVGPDAVPAPPFASVYLEEEPRLMGRSTLEVRELFHGLGLAAPEGGAPDDFLPYELEAWMRLCALEARVPGETGRKAVQDARRWLVREHMALWLPKFTARAAEASPSPVMAEIMMNLENWLHAVKENV